MLEAETFFETHRKHKTTIKDLPLLDASDEEIAIWALKGGHGDWLKLNLSIPIKSFLKDEKLATNSYVNHRDAATGEGTHKGWASCTLHGISVEKTNHWSIYGYDSEPEYHWTDLGEKTKHIKKFCESLPFERFVRVRFMRLSAGGHITPHDDNSDEVNWNNVWQLPLPINIAIDHPAACFMTIQDSGVVPFKSGDAYLVNILKTHSVINFSSQDRKHIIIHGVVGNRKEEYCKLLADSYRTQYDKIQSKQ
jgi:hypothetical protein